VDCRNLLDLAVDEIAAPARIANEAMAPMPANTHSLARLPLADVWTDCINASGDFVSWDTRVLNGRQKSFFDEHITVANAARLDLDAHLTTIGLRNGTFNKFEVSTRFANLNGFHGAFLK
jgi:hypothetical protein